jgi:hypothetical protein
MLKRFGLLTFGVGFVALWGIGLADDLRQGEYGRAAVGYVIMPVAALRGALVLTSFRGKELALAQAAVGAP